MNLPIPIWFINTETAIYYSIGNNNLYFSLVDDPEKAAVIVFENHSPKEIVNSIEFRKWPEKCITVNAEDRPDYFLPGCYASNTKCFLNQGRGCTIPYMRMQREGPNYFIKTAPADYTYLYAFRGGATSWVRKKLFKQKTQRDDVFIAASNNYIHWSVESSYQAQKAILQKEYADLLNQSLFFLCPRGAGSGSIRLFEVMQAGRVPVILSDDWIPVENLDWDEFSIRIPEKDIDQIDGIIRSYKDRAASLGSRALQVYYEHFAPGPDFALLANAITSIQANRNEKRERLIRSIFPLLGLQKRMKHRGYQLVKSLILKTFALTGRKFPYALNRPIEEQLHK